MFSLGQELDPKWNIKVSKTLLSEDICHLLATTAQRSIKVTLIEPGAFQTRGSSPESLVQTTPHPAYADPKSTVSFIRGYINNTPLSGDTDKGTFLPDALQSSDY